MYCPEYGAFLGNVFKLELQSTQKSHLTNHFLTIHPNWSSSRGLAAFEINRDKRSLPSFNSWTDLNLPDVEMLTEMYSLYLLSQFTINPWMEPTVQFFKSLYYEFKKTNCDQNFGGFSSLKQLLLHLL